MRRQEAVKINEQTREEVAPRGIRIFANSELINKLTTSDGKLEEDEIEQIGKFIVSSAGFNHENQFALATTNNELSNSLSNINQQLFIIFKTESSPNWSTMVIKKSNYTTTAYLMNPFNNIDINSIQSIFNQKLGFVTLKINNKRSNLKDFDDFLALKHLEMMTKEDLNNFENFNLATTANIEDMKKRLKQAFLKNIHSSHISDISRNSNFKAKLREFMDQCCEYSELSILAINYYQTLQTEAENLENEGPRKQQAIRNIEAARLAFLNDEKVEKLKNMEVSGQANDFKLKIQEDFPEEMKSFKSFMDILKNSDNQAKVDVALREFAEKIGYDYEKLKKFFIIQKLNEDTTATNPHQTIPLNSIKLENPKPAPSSPEPNVKPIDQLLDEMEMEDSDESNDEAIKSALRNEFSQMKSHQRNWNSKSAADIRAWSTAKRGKLIREEIPEAMAILNRANSLTKGWHSLRDAQILSVLSYFHTKSNHGAFYEILTGEGKTVIVSLLAVLKILMGEKYIDVITSNTVLAEEGMRESKDFYAIFDISVGCNDYKKEYKRDVKECYQADVCYGTMGNFQGDYLRHEFERLNTRGDRKFGCIILDEVDSILLDNGGHITKLATPFPGMDSLKYVYIKIWQELLKIEDKLPETTKAKISAKERELQNDDDKERKLQQYSEEVLSNSYSDIKTAIKATNPADIDLIPPHLRDFARKMVEKWIKNAIYARYQCYEDVHYVIRKDKGEDVIIPVDYQNTGVTLKNTVWSDGLHQFVQLKHNLNIATETLTSSFISNIGYVKLYENNLIGMTGTLGSKAEYDLLSKVYNLNYIKIPPFKIKNFFEEDGIIVEDSSWVDLISTEAFLMAKSKRSVLIICRTILEVFTIKKSIEFLQKLENFTDLKIKLYPDEASKDIVKGKVGCSEIVIATNIAGRGSNFKTTPELEANGGLHVCVSFLPTNRRVQDQAFGRTSRQGNDGTAQIIAKATDFFEYGGNVDQLNYFEFYDVEMVRDKNESERLKKISLTELPKIQFMDEIFQKFLKFYGERRDKEGYTKPYLKDLKEFWAFWLKNKEYNEVTGLDVNTEFQKFVNEVNPYLNTQTYRNPFYYVDEAEQMIRSLQHDKAKELLNKAINSVSGNSECLYTANIKLFELSIESGQAMQKRIKTLLKKVAIYGYFENQTENRQYITDAQNYLRKARQGLNNEIDYINNNYFDGKLDEMLSHGVVPNSLSDKSELSSRNKRDLTSNSASNSNSTSKNQNQPISLLKHINSRFTILKTFSDHLESMEQQLNSIDNVIVKSRIPNYLSDLKPESENERKLKETVLPSELRDLSMIGLDVFYSLQEVHDVSNTVIIGAQAQVAAGLAALAVGFAFPPALPFCGPAAGALISEGICDIVIELLKKMGDDFDWKQYAKDKAISYGIAIASFGISAIASAFNLLTKIMNMVKNVAKALKACPVLTKVAQKVAQGLEKLAKGLQKVIEKGQKMKNLQGTFQQVGRNVAAETFRDAIFTVVSEKIVTQGLNELLDKLKPQLKEDCKRKAREIISNEDLSRVSMKKLSELLTQLSTESTGAYIGDIAKEIGLGVLRVSRNWALKLSSLGMDALITTSSLTAGLTSYCHDLKKALNQQTIDRDASNYPAEYKIDTIATHMSEHMYGQIIKILGRGVNTIVVSPTIAKISESFSSGRRNVESDELIVRSDGMDMSRLDEAYRVLGLSPGASEREIGVAFRRLALEHHTDRRGGDGEMMARLVNARDDIMASMESPLNFTVPTAPDRGSSNAPRPSAPTEAPNQPSATDTSSTSSRSESLAHSGNIITLSNAFGVNTRVNVIDPATSRSITTHQFGRQFSGSRTMTIDYFPSTHDRLGHFTIQGQQITPSGELNCLYDAFSVGLRNFGITESPNSLRDIGGSSSVANFQYGLLNRVSNLLNNPISRNVYIRAQNAILVGGALAPLPIDENGVGHYPSNIKYDKAVIAPATIHIYNEVLYYAEQLRQLRRPQRTFDHIKLAEGGAMVGVMKAELFDKNSQKTIEWKAWAMSGNSEYNLRQNILNRDLNSIQISGTNDTYRFIDFDYNAHMQNDPFVYDINGNRSAVRYLQSCSAVKLSIGLSNFLAQNPGKYEVRERFMAEVYFSSKGTLSSKLNNENINGRVIDSCSKCQLTIPHTHLVGTSAPSTSGTSRPPQQPSSSQTPAWRPPARGPGTGAWGRPTSSQTPSSSGSNTGQPTTGTSTGQSSTGTGHPTTGTTGSGTTPAGRPGGVSNRPPGSVWGRPPGGSGP